MMLSNFREQTLLDHSRVLFRKIGQARDRPLAVISMRSKLILSWSLKPGVETGVVSARNG